jgi:hypothetical protein
MIIDLLAAFGVYVICRKAYGAYKLLFEDRDGNSGRMTHWLEGRE